MTATELETERNWFNALSIEDAKRIMADAEGQRPDFRSCWYCNGSHQHLKNRDVIFCFACGFYYLSGYPAQAVARRAEGRDVTPEEMAQFNEALELA